MNPLQQLISYRDEYFAGNVTPDQFKKNVDGLKQKFPQDKDLEKKINEVLSTINLGDNGKSELGAQASQVQRNVKVIHEEEQGFLEEAVDKFAPKKPTVEGPDMAEDVDWDYDAKEELAGGTATPSDEQPLVDEDEKDFDWDYDAKEVPGGGTVTPTPEEQRLRELMAEDDEPYDAATDKERLDRLLNEPDSPGPI